MFNILERLVFRRMSKLLYLGIAIALLSSCCKKNDICCNILRAKAQVNTGIRFYYFESVRAQQPVVFVSVSGNDSRLNTAVWSQQGRIVYVSMDEASHIMHALSRLNILWHYLSNVSTFGDVQSLTPVNRMTITIVSSKGTIEGSVDPRSVCSVLASIDGAFISPRALWESQMFRTEYDCQVPGLQRSLYKDR